MDNLNELGEALPELQEDINNKLPYDLRRKIFKEYEIAQMADINFYRNRLEETQEEIQRRRQQMDDAQNELFFGEPEVFIMEDYVNPAETILTEAEDAFNEAERNAAQYTRMMELIELQINNRGRLLRIRNEPPF